MATRKKADTADLTATVQTFFEKYNKFQTVKQKYDSLKAEFEDVMLEYFDTLGKGRKSVKFDGGNATEDGSRIVVSKVERSKVEWLPDKLKQRTPKEFHKILFKKRYEITDIHGLTRYLKSCGVDPKIFKAFLSVEETVDEKALELLDETGQLTLRMISGCYMVHCQKPYFTVKVEKANGNREQSEEG